MIINTNASSLFTQNYLRLNNNELETTMAKLSSGKRINKASDDAAGLAIVARMNTQVRGMDVAVRNAGDGVSMLETAESAMGSITDILQRVRELAVQADNGTYNTTDRKSMDDEVSQLLDEVTHIRDSARFNGIELLSGSPTLTTPGNSKSVDLHISDLHDDTVGVELFDVGLEALTLDAVSITTAGTGNGAGVSAQDTISLVDAALDKISSNRAALGAMTNRLQFTIDNLETSKQNTATARSRIEDADMAKEASNMTKSRVLIQSSMSMLSQANQTPQMVMQLLQGM